MGIILILLSNIAWTQAEQKDWDARQEKIRKIVAGEVQRAHELEMAKAQIEIQTRLAEAQAPKVYVNGVSQSSSYARNGQQSMENSTRLTNYTSSNSSALSRQSQSLESDIDNTSTNTLRNENNSTNTNTNRNL